MITLLSEMNKFRSPLMAVTDVTNKADLCQKSNIRLVKGK